MNVTALAAVVLALSAPTREPDKRSDRLALLREVATLYASSQHPEAIARLAQWTEGELQEQAAAVETAFTARERCPACPSLLTGLPLRAAIMVHADRDRELRYRDAGEEQLRACPGELALLARRYATLLARDPATRAFSRSFFLAMAMRCQWDACFANAAAWSDASRKLFTGDAEILLTAGSILEERAFVESLIRPESGRAFGRAPSFSMRDQVARQSRPQVEGEGPGDWLKAARRLFTEAIRIEPELVLARVRLGRVLWRLGEAEAAREVLEEAMGAIRDPNHAYLAHLFLGRVHEDAGRLDRAVAEYTRAVDLDPLAQSAAVALSNALHVAGDTQGARRALARGLSGGPRPSASDVYWSYFVTNAVDVQDRFAALRREALEP